MSETSDPPEGAKENPIMQTPDIAQEHGPEPETGSKNPIRWGQAFRALWALSRDLDDTTHVFRIVDALRGNSDAENVARMRESLVGRQILDERRDMLDVLADRERLRTLPEGSLGRVYLEFMEREGLSAEGLAEASESGHSPGSDSDERIFGNWARDSHDLWHVLTGYGRDPLGELCLLGVLYSQIGNLGTAFIALLGLVQIPFEYIYHLLTLPSRHHVVWYCMLPQLDFVSFRSCNKDMHLGYVMRGI